MSLRYTLSRVVALLLVSAGLTPALAMEPPSFELLDDLDRWERGQDRLIDGPAGCWEMVGEAKQVVTFHQPPDFFSAARNESFPMSSKVSGRLVDGVWAGELTRVAKEDPDAKLDLDIDVYPLFGSMPEGDGDDANELSINIGDGQAQVGGSIGTSTNLLREAIDVRSGSAETSYSRWDKEADAVVYDRQIPVAPDDDRPIAVAVRFPEAGPTADRVDAIWPKLIKLGEWPLKVKIRDAQMHVVGHPVGDQMFPWAESVSFVAGALGYTVGYEQRVTWVSATPCTSEAAEPTEPEAPAE